MIRLIYISTARSALNTPHIKDILASSRENNRLSGITGLLVYHEGVFFQVLEGDRRTVTDSFARISRDWRHKGCQVLFNETVPGRAFADWSMAYRRGDELTSRQVSQLHDICEVAGKCRDGDFSDEPMLEVFLRAFLVNFRLIEA